MKESNTNGAGLGKKRPMEIDGGSVVRDGLMRRRQRGPLIYGKGWSHRHETPGCRKHGTDHKGGKVTQPTSQ